VFLKIGMEINNAFVGMIEAAQEYVSNYCKVSSAGKIN